MFHTTAIDEVWGIGRRISAKLNVGGIAPIADFLKADVHTLRRRRSTDVDKATFAARAIQLPVTVALRDDAD